MEENIKEETKVEQDAKTDEKKIIDTLFKERDTYQTANQTQRAEFDDIYNVYIGKMENVKSLPYRTQESSSKLRTEIAYVVPQIFSGNPQVEVEGIGEEDKTIAAILEKMINYRFQTIPQFYEKIEAWVKQSATFGTSLLKVLWRFETEEKGEGEESYKVPTKDEPDVEIPNIKDCFYNPIISDVYCQKSIIFKSTLPIHEVKENPAYDFVGFDGQLNREKLTASGSKATNVYDSSNQEKSDQIDSQKAGDGMVDIYERVTSDRIQTVADGKERLVLRDTPWVYGYINAVKLVHEPSCIPNRFEGWGVGQNTMGVGKLYHRMWNQTIEGVKMTNNPMFIAKKGMGIDPRQAVAKPGGVIFVDPGQDPLANAILPIQFPDTKQGAANLLEKLEDEHRRASGANDLVQGSASNKTLGQDQLASTYSSQRFELIQRRFKQALSDVAEMIIRMEIQNLQSPDSPILRIFPVELREQIYQLIINEAQDIKFNVSIKGDTNIVKNKDVQIKQFTDIYNLVAGILPPENQFEWVRKMLEFRGVDDIDKLVPDPEQYAQQMQQQAMGAVNPQMLQEGGMMPEVPQPQAM